MSQDSRNKFYRNYLQEKTKKAEKKHKEELRKRAAQLRIFYKIIGKIMAQLINLILGGIDKLVATEDAPTHNFKFLKIKGIAIEQLGWHLVDISSTDKKRYSAFLMNNGHIGLSDSTQNAEIVSWVNISTNIGSGEQVLRSDYKDIVSLQDSHQDTEIAALQRLQDFRVITICDSMFDMAKILEIDVSSLRTEYDKLLERIQ